MRNRAKLLLFALLLVASISVSLPANRADEVKPAPTDPITADVVRWTKNDIADLQQVLAAARLEKKDRKRAFVMAFMIGANAETIAKLDKSRDWMAVHAQAGRIMAALKDENTAAAKAAAADLHQVRGPGNGIELVKHYFDPAVRDWDRDLVMQLCKTPRAGGLGIEVKIKNWVALGVPRNDLDSAAEVAQKMLVLGMALEKMAPPPALARAKPQWIQFSRDLQASATETVNAAAGKKNPQATGTAIGKIDAACTRCHGMFK